jgi:hypothetical protein
MSPTAAARAVDEYRSARGWATFSVHLRWDPAAKQGAGAKHIQFPPAWKSNDASSISPEWNGVAVDTGKSGLVVLDFDGERGLEMAARLRAHLPAFETLTARSGSGGEHWYFCADADPARALRNATHVPLFDRVRNDSNVDLRADGGCIIAPPTSFTGPAGEPRRYEWIDPLAHPIPMPHELRGLLLAGERGRARGGIRGPVLARCERSAEASFTTPAERVDPVFVADIVAVLSGARAEAYSDWIRVGLALKRAERRAGGEPPFFSLWEGFSRRCPGKYPGEANLRRMWDAMDVDSNRADAVGVGTLVEMARQDDALGARAAIASRNQRRGIDSSVEPSSADAHEAVRLISQKLPDHFPADAVDACLEADGKALRVTSGACTALVSARYDVTIGGTFVGNLINDAELKLGPVSWMAGALPTAAKVFRFDRRVDDEATLTSVSEGAEAKLLITDSMVEVTVPGKRVVVSSEKKRKALDARVLAAMNEYAAAQMPAIHNAFHGTCAALVNNGVQNILVSTEGEKNQDFVECRDILLDSARELKLRKANGFIWQQVRGCPLAYEPVMTGPNKAQQMTYAKLINTTLADNEAFNNNPRRLADLVAYLEGYTSIKHIPEYEPSRDVLSFANGFLRLASGEFHPYGAADELELAARHGGAARHHIPQSWTGETATPLLDKILAHQFPRDVADLLCALLGRALFRVGQLDDWQVAPYLVGAGETGKSVLLAALTALLRPGSVGNLAPKREEIFGMANLVDKELVVGRDLPKKLSAVIPQETLQSMVTGEDIEVARKNLTATNVTWTAPTVFTSNHMPDYVSTGGNSSRRLVPFGFNTPVAAPDYSLKARILREELPNIVARCLECYRRLRARIDAEGIPFWSAVPQQILEWKNSMSAATNALHRFLDMDEEERGCRIERMEGRITWVRDLAAAMEAVCGAKTFHKDATVLAAFGFTTNPDGRRVNVCRSCKQVARIGCCPAFNRANRCTKDVIYDMVICPIE